MVATSKEDAAAAREQKRQEAIEKMLPWTLENKVSACLIIVKVPLIFIVAVIGISAETRVKMATDMSWIRWGSAMPGGKPSCYAHHLNATLRYDLGEVDIVGKLNESLGGVLDGDILSHNVSLDPLKSVADEDFCSITTKCEPSEVHSDNNGYITTGIDHLIPFALLWFIYKLLFIGVHPLDRLMKRVTPSDEGGEPPEPIFMLLTEPYFQVCTTVMKVFVKIFCYIRYRLMPNALLGALVSMSPHPKCPDIIYYKLDMVFGTACYYMIVLDIITTGGAYALAKTVLGGKLVGKWSYRFYKTGWFISCFFSNTFAIGHLIYTFGGIKEILNALRRTFKILLTMNINFTMNLDLLRLFMVVVIILEAIEFQFFIYSLICPPIIRKCCPCINLEQTPEEGADYKKVADGDA
mmetsp:Transcript_43681/g.139171  ORF Transcript_43681/g.139171 Transcript_43681/m.139171 type:complete len:409 (-) Transcript_43681:200-1426(-)